MAHLQVSEPVRTQVTWAFQQVAWITLGVALYFGVRGQTAGSPDVARDHALDIVALEKDLGIQIEEGLQSPVTTSATLEAVANWIYIWGHWPVIIATMMWLLWKHRTTFIRLRDAMMISGVVGMLIFAAYPVMPPRLVGLGMVDTVTRTSESYRLLQPPVFTNQYAAMPSLHSGWDLLVGIAIVAAASTAWLRAVGFILPMLMAVAVVFTANHYILDVVAGVTLVLFAYAGALALERRRLSQQSACGMSESPTVLRRR